MQNISKRDAYAVYSSISNETIMQTNPKCSPIDMLEEYI